MKLQIQKTQKHRKKLARILEYLGLVRRYSTRIFQQPI
jgi:hypothetical protein